MRIFGMGPIEILIIVAIILVIFGPGLFKKIGKRGKETLDSAKKGIENGAAQNGKELDLDNVSKDDIMEGVGKIQDKVDDMFEKEEAKKAEKAEEQSRA